MSKNKNVSELHGCLVCGRLYDVLAVYGPDKRLVDCKVTSPDGRIVPDEFHPLVACKAHSTDEIESAYHRRQAALGGGSYDEPEED